MDQLAASLARSPELFPLDLDPVTDQVALIRLTEADYHQMSFLDARILTPHTLRRGVSWAQLEAAVSTAQLEETASYVFHIGHAGSSLLSRLLGTHPQVFALREPAILRTLAHVHCQNIEVTGSDRTSFNDRLATVLRLLSRAFRPEQHTVVKATSFVSELAVQILVRPSRPKAVLMYVRAETYLATILGAPNSPKEARQLAASRLRRLHARIGNEQWRLAKLSEGEMVAMSWASEIMALAAAAEAAPGRTFWLNFDSFLEVPVPSLFSAFRFFDIDATAAKVESIVSGPELQRYAKAPEHAYDSNLRSEILGQARKERADEIARGLAWLDRAAKAFTPLEYALSLG
jgi:hypothetical protein